MAIGLVQELMNRLISETQLRWLIAESLGQLHMVLFHVPPGPEGKQEAFNHIFGSGRACSASISLRALVT